MKSILKKWVQKLGLRHQGVLITAVRGCDGMAKEDVTKPLARELRGIILVPFDERELKFDKGFMTGFPSKSAENGFINLLRSLDHYPVHYLFHLIHAIEIIGYCHPDSKIKAIYFLRYQLFCRKLHMGIESENDFNQRLFEDRIENGTVES